MTSVNSTLEIVSLRQVVCQLSGYLGASLPHSKEHSPNWDALDYRNIRILSLCRLTGMKEDAFQAVSIDAFGLVSVQCISEQNERGSLVRA